ncbi:MAG: hypothetical protein HYS05_11895 [Acidobacteria bacterium]|nr:hypothetical protein [Acidobacteriota bacterium]
MPFDRRFFAVLLLASFALTACGIAMQSPRIAELKDNPARYHDRRVQVEGVVTSSWGLPLVPFKVYRIDDGTGELTIISQGDRVPTRGARVRVTGRVNEVGTFGGRAVGLHVREDRLRVLGH